MKGLDRLATHVDSVVLLCTAEDSVPEAWIEALAQRLPVFRVEGEAAPSEPAAPSCVKRLHVPPGEDGSRAGRIHEALLAEYAIRPLVVTDGADFQDVLAATRAPLKVLLTSAARLATSGFPFTGEEFGRLRGRSNQYQALATFHGSGAAAPFAEAFEALPPRLRLRRTLAHVDFVLCDSAAGLAGLQDCAGRNLPGMVVPPHLDDLLKRLVAAIEASRPESPRLNVLVLYDHYATHVNTHQEYLDSFARYSTHRVFYAPATREAECRLDLSGFDVVVAQYSLRMFRPVLEISPSYQEALKRFGGYKALFIQDEYDITENTRRRMREFGFHSVFTCVPPEYVEAVYPSARFPHTRFVTVLTGYVPPSLEQDLHVPSMAERKTLIGYRGRALPYWYGDLGQEKIDIGKRMRAICDSRGIPVDIEWEDSHRLYSDSWYHFLKSCKATLGTESGANIFDDDGSLRAAVQAELEANPEVSYQEVFEKHLAPHEGKVMMNQVSPKIFEAIALRTVLILYEGTYSGVIQPDVHFIPLKKDFSNVDEVLARLHDDAYLTAMAERAFQDVVASGRYSYRRFVQDVDAHLAGEIRRGGGREPVSAVVGWRDPLDEQVHAADTSLPRHYPATHVVSYALDFWSEVIPIDDSPPPVPPEPEPDAALMRRERLKRIPLALWVDDNLLKPFNRLWEHHRRRLTGGNGSPPSAERPVGRN